MKRRGKHTTLIDGLEPILQVLHRHPEIEISPGRITTGLPTGKHLLKIKQLSGGVELIFRGTRTKQILHLYGNGGQIETILREETKIMLINPRKGMKMSNR